jgi:hypothetical protein
MDHDFRPEMVPELREIFYEFMHNIVIDSKELGPAPLEPYYGQRLFLDSVFDGLQNDIHWFVVLKARQLGITTVSIALDIFWLSFFPGLQGGLVTDTEGNKDKLRILIDRILKALPNSHSIPVERHNRSNLVLANGSSLDYLVAGTRKNGGLGRSRAFNFLHATECSSWGDQEGLESLQKSLAAKFPARLYVFESTARGYNMFHNMWEEAKEDYMTKKGIFIGWWAKEDYSFQPHRSFKERELFDRYGTEAPNKDEQELINIVKKNYDFDVTMEQLAWYRHEENPSGEADMIFENSGSIISQELPWHEEQAFMLTGASFFSLPMLNEAAKISIKDMFKGFRYHMGEEFLATSIEQVRVAKLSMLKIWEDPDPAGTYVIGADPAYGSSDEADRFCAQVFRVYADGMDQVAEFISPTIKTYQFTWIIAHLAGLYANARLILEINGPGEAVLTEFRNLKTQLSAGLITPKDENQNIRNVLLNVRNYLYTRADSMGGGAQLHWKTTATNKLVIFNQFRDGFSIGQIRIRSVECLEEMKKIVQDGISIKGEGSAKDDRVMACALATRGWIDGERKHLQAQGKTRKAEAEAKDLSHVDMNKIFTSNIIADFLNRQRIQREHSARMQRKTNKGW